MQTIGKISTHVIGITHSIAADKYGVTFRHENENGEVVIIEIGRHALEAAINNYKDVVDALETLDRLKEYH